MAYALLHQTEYAAARSEFEAANAEMKQMLLQEDDEPWGTDSKILADGKMLFSLLAAREGDWETSVRQTVAEIERDALKSAWRMELWDGTHIRALT